MVAVVSSEGTVTGAGTRLRRGRVVLAVLALALAFGRATPAFAIDETTRVLLRQVSTEGVHAYQEGNYELAVQKLEKAWSIMPTAPIGLWSGRALEKSGRLVEASGRYLAAKRAPLDPDGERDTQEAARAEASEAYQALQARIPAVTVKVSGADPSELELTVAGKNLLVDFIGLPVPVDPGKVEVTARTSSGKKKSVFIVLAEGDKQEVTLDLGEVAAPAAVTPTASDAPDASPHAKGSWQPVAGWIGIGLGGAGLIFGTVTGAVVLAKYNELGCGASDGLCDADESQTKPVNDLRPLSTIGFVAGGVLMAAGVTLLVTAPKAERQATIRPYWTVDSVGVVGTF